MTVALVQVGGVAPLEVARAEDAETVKGKAQAGRVLIGPLAQHRRQARRRSQVVVLPTRGCGSATQPDAGVRAEERSDSLAVGWG